MTIDLQKKHIIIAPQIYVPLDADFSEAGYEPRLRQAEIPMTWTQEGEVFRLDIDLPGSGVLDVYFSSHVGSLYVNGETIWENQTIYAVRSTGIHAEVTPAGLRLTCTKEGPIHLLARCVGDLECS
jgi:hypothetical protein